MDGPGARTSPVGARLTVSRPTTETTRGLGGLASAIRDRLGQRDVLSGLAAAGLSFVLCWSIFTAWVHYSYEGYYFGPFLLAEQVGLPALEVESGIKTVVPVAEGAGWDGQYAYHVSNDLLCKADTAEFLDQANRRYQRVGIPMIANIISTLLGQPVTSPGLYHLIQIGLVSCGFGLLVWWMVKHGQPASMALIWFGSLGVVHSLAHGLPDAPADVFFLAAMIGLIIRRLWIYVPAAILMGLCHESYLAFSATVFVGTVGTLIPWGDNGPGWRGFCTALPVFAVLIWAVFVAVGVEGPMFVGSEPAVWGGMFAAPFAAWRASLGHAWDRGDSFEIHLLLSSAAVLITVGGVIIWAAIQNKANRIFLTVLPLVLLMAMSGSNVWESFRGHQTALGTFLVIGLMILPFNRGWLLPFVLSASLIVSFYGIFMVKVWDAPQYGPLPTTVTVADDAPANEVINDFRSSVQIREADVPDYDGIWKPFHRCSTLFVAEVNNHSTQTWQPNPPVSYPMSVALGWQVFDETGKLIREGRQGLPRAVEPGTGIALEFRVGTLPEGGSYTLRASMVQEAHQRFSDLNPDFEGVLELNAPTD